MKNSDKFCIPDSKINTNFHNLRKRNYENLLSTTITENKNHTKQLPVFDEIFENARACAGCGNGRKRVPQLELG